MEEASALCDRLGIFVDGQLVCVGPPKQLTARHGGYLVFTITTPPEQVCVRMGAGVQCGGRVELGAVSPAAAAASSPPEQGGGGSWA